MLPEGTILPDTAIEAFEADAVVWAVLPFPTVNCDSAITASSCTVLANTL